MQENKTKFLVLAILSVLIMSGVAIFLYSNMRENIGNAPTDTTISNTEEDKTVVLKRMLESATGNESVSKIVERTVTLDKMMASSKTLTKEQIDLNSKILDSLK